MFDTMVEIFPASPPTVFFTSQKSRRGKSNNNSSTESCRGAFPRKTRAHAAIPGLMPSRSSVATLAKGFLPFRQTAKEGAVGGGVFFFVIVFFFPALDGDFFVVDRSCCTDADVFVYTAFFEI